MGRRLLLCAAAAVAAATVLAGPAAASQLVDRDATAITLKVDNKGRALVEYRVHGTWRHVLAWGAINARMPRGTARPSTPQVKFKLDYSGGWGTYHKLVWRSFHNACRAYDGPGLAMTVATCKAPDGSFWALQSWQVELPDLGFAAWTGDQKRWHLQLSHWRGHTALIEAHTGWVHGGRIHSVFGRITYLGVPVHGYGTTQYGAPTDKYGRLVYLDTYDSAYGAGWRRENSFVTHRPNGNFCYGFYGFNPMSGGYSHPPGYPGGNRPQGTGAKYRIIFSGPGVTPDVTWTGDGLPDYDPNDPTLVQYEQNMLARNSVLAAGDRTCQSTP